MEASPANAGAGRRDLKAVIRPRVSLILPAWNEQEAVEHALTEAEASFAELDYDYEIIVVDDGSADQTAEVAERRAAENPRIRVIRHDGNRGYGAAIRSGMDAASMDLVAFTDADCQFEMRELGRFELLSRDYDIVCGYRIDRQDTWLRCFYSTVYNSLVRTLLRTGVRDVDCALKMFHREHLPHLKIKTNGFLVNSEILTRARQENLSIVEVGVTHRPRQFGVSTVSARHIPGVLTSLLRFWWAAVMFPQAELTPSPAAASAAAPPTPPADRRGSSWTTPLLAALAVAMLFTNLGYPLIDRDETRYAEIPREMLVRGDWVVPHLNFEPYFDKPPLFYWLCAASFKWLGMSEWSARLIPALSALATIFAVGWFGTRHFGPRVGQLSMLVLTLTGGFLLCGRYLLIDSLLTLIVTATLFAAFEAFHFGRVRWRWWVGCAVGCGLGMLAKGPIAWVLCGPPVLAYLWLNPAAARPSWRHCLAFTAILTAIVVPWFAAMISRAPGFAHEFFYQHHIARFAGAFHAKPIWFFVPVFLIGGLPWTFLLAPYARFLFSSDVESRRRRPQVLGFLLLAAAWCLWFFTMSSGKLPTYILPAAPLLALAVAHYLDHALSSASAGATVFQLARERTPWVASTMTCGGMTVAACVAYGMKLSGLAGLALFAGAWGGALWALLRWAPRVRDRAGWGVCCGVAALALLQASQCWLPAVGRSHAVLVSHSKLSEMLQDPQRPIASFAKEHSGFPFYLQRSDIRNFKIDEVQGLAGFVASHESTLVVAKTGVDPQLLRAGMPSNTRLINVGRIGNALIYRAERPLSTATAPSDSAAR